LVLGLAVIFWNTLRWLQPNLALFWRQSKVFAVFHAILA
jgi:hypothetical protein